MNEKTVVSSDDSSKDIESPGLESQGLAQDKSPEVGERTIRGFKWFLTVVAILASTFLFALDTTVVADIQPNIIQSLGEFEKFPWLGSAFVLPSASLVLIWSKAYSLFDVKWLYFAHVTIFEIGSAISGAAPTMNALIVGRAIAGIGGCGMYVGGLTFFSVITTVKERPIYVSLVTPVWGIGTVLGPVIGGAFAESNVGWRWGFYINLFIFAAVAPVMLFILPSLNFAPTLSPSQKLRRLDWLGLVFFSAWCICFIMGLQFGGTVYAWNSPSEIILWVFVGVLAVGFAVTHKLHPWVNPDDRLYPAHMLKNWKLGILQFATFAAPSAVYIPIYYIPLFFQFARGETPVEAAVRLLPFVFMIVTFSILNGFFMSKLGYYMPWFLAGGLLAVVGGALMLTVGPDTTTAQIYGYSVVLGIGGGCFLMSAFGCVSAVVEPSDVFNAIGVMSVAQAIGIVFFVAAAGLIYQNLGVNYIRPFIPSDYTGALHGILAGSSSPEFLSFPENIRHEIARSIVSAMGKLYTLTIAGSGLTALLSPLLGFGKVG
ncbi:hypothetical protein DL768_007962 [Monosporascus sp. mg162]|nr:hypothetical protein DL768_007962 [Monosporascus sp. mg162]